MNGNIQLTLISLLQPLPEKSSCAPFITYFNHATPPVCFPVPPVVYSPG